jgi:ABC-type nickel/cobalt efflux system permease component RcnA
VKPLGLRLALFLASLLAGGASAFAAAMRPFSVGGGEGGGGATGGVTGWLLNEQSKLTHLMSAHLTALSGDSTAIWGLVGLGFAYGVFHAAGPGHGKAVIASYMMANDRALRRGVVLAFLAALLQGAVAVALVGVAALIFNATAAEMNRAANALALASYVGIALIGAWLVWKKGRALVSALRQYFARHAVVAEGALFAGAPWRTGSTAFPSATFRAFAPARERAVFDDDGCGHAHAPDPSQLGDGFSLRGAAATVVAAGARPCSGAILVLVFSLARNVFPAGIAATFAMSLGTALTTGALAWAAVFAKRLAVRFASGEDSRVALIARGFEFAAALLVLGFGVALLVGSGAAA